MTLKSRFLPHPTLSLVIIVLWMALAQNPGLGSLVLGAILGVAIPIATQRFWPERPHIFAPMKALILFARVVTDIIAANIHVARLVLGPTGRLSPAFIEVPTSIEDPFVATILGSIISLTPGTVTTEVDRYRNVLLVHALDVADEAALIATIKSRYEAPLKEIFRC